MFDRAHSIALLLGRVAVGIIFVAHGWQKFTEMGLDGTTQFFEASGVPLAGIAAPGVAILELVGGIALIAGALLPVFGVLLALDMAGAILFVHAPNGLLGEGGYELVLALGVASLMIAFSRGGLLAIDGLLFHRSRGVAGEPTDAQVRAR